MMPSFHWWRTVFWLIPAISVYTLVLGALSLASLGVDRRGRLAHRCARAWAWLILQTTGVRTSARGLDHLDRRVPYVFVSNHQSIYDIPVLFVALPVQLRIIAKGVAPPLSGARLAPALDRPSAGGTAPAPGPALCNRSRA